MRGARLTSRSGSVDKCPTMYHEFLEKSKDQIATYVVVGLEGDLYFVIGMD